MRVHIVPVNDLVEHDTGNDCLCGPTETLGRISDDLPDSWLVVHHSLDGREHREA